MYFCTDGLNAPQAYNQGVEADRKLHGQHTPYYIPSGYPNERKLWFLIMV